MKKFQCPYCNEQFDSIVKCDEHKRNDCDERPLFQQ